jgi:hypothetical protein
MLKKLTKLVKGCRTDKDERRTGDVMAAALHTKAEAGITASVREIIVEHYPYRSCAKNKTLLPFWMGNERHAGLVIFLKTSNGELVFLRRIKGLDSAKVAWKKSMIREVYRELVDVVLTFKLNTFGPRRIYTVNTILPNWMNEASYRQLKERRSAIKEK